MPAPSEPLPATPEPWPASPVLELEFPAPPEPSAPEMTLPASTMLALEFPVSPVLALEFPAAVLALEIPASAFPAVVAGAAGGTAAECQFILMMQWSVASLLQMAHFGGTTDASLHHDLIQWG